ncbi:MAG: ComEC/Rec2 family competence protein [Bacteroidales bacterium]|nr:ComEC/Rec2 family competence protein [Bacteroidales bacterium]
MDQWIFDKEIKKIPFLRFLIPFIIGICIQNYVPFKRYHINILYIFSLTILVFYVIRRNKLKLANNEWINGIIINILIFIAGLSLSYSKNMVPQYVNNDPAHCTYIAYIAETPDTSEIKNKYLVRIISYKKDNNWYKTKGKAIVYLPKNEKSSSLSTGSTIVFHSKLFPYLNRGNPEEFNYQRYMNSKNIYCYTYIKNESWRYLEKKTVTLRLLSIQIRQHIHSLYQKYGINNSELAVLSALTLGDRSELDADLNKAYAQSGAMHILAVSGLHIGILYLVLNFLLVFRKKRKFMKVTIILLCIWFYAIITGLSPSVQRAAIMFSFISLGKAGKRDINIYNILSLSALIILLFDPRMLFQAGFQFSFLAVAGIIFFQPRISSLLKPKTKAMNFAWQLLSVSFAAQLSTFPLTLYYFQYFPSYFWITNLLIIPIIPLLYSCAILLIIFSFSNIIASSIAWIISLTIRFLNLLTNNISSLPGSTINEISISKTEVILIYLIIISLAVSFLTYNKKWLLASLSCIVLFICSDILSEYKAYTQNRFIVYNTPDKSLAQMIDGKVNIIVTTIQSKNDISSILYAITPPQITYRQEKAYFYSNNESLNTITTGKNWKIRNIRDNTFIINESGITLFLQNDSVCIHMLNRKLSLDKIVLCNAMNLSIEEILKSFETKCIIIDSSIPVFKADAITNACNKEGIKCHYSGHSAYIEEI